jgi:hypothetical protein
VVRHLGATREQEMTATIGTGDTAPPTLKGSRSPRTVPTAQTSLAQRKPTFPVGVSGSLPIRAEVRYRQQ